MTHAVYKPWTIRGRSKHIKQSGKLPPVVTKIKWRSMVPKMDTDTTGSKNLSVPPGRKNLSMPPVSIITTGGNQILYLNFGTMLPNFGTGFKWITKFLVIWYILKSCHAGKLEITFKVIQSYHGWYRLWSYFQFGTTHGNKLWLPPVVVYQTVNEAKSS